jgi:hypothetical protein
MVNFISGAGVAQSVQGLGYGLDDWGSFPGHSIQTGCTIQLASNPKGTGALTLGVKRPEREVDHSSPPSGEVKNAWSYTSTPQ